MGGRLGLDKAWWAFFFIFPECPVLALGKGPLPRVPGKTLGEVFLFFFVLFASFFCEAFPHYLKLHVQIWDNFDFFCYISLVFFVSLNFFCILQI